MGIVNVDSIAGIDLGRPREDFVSVRTVSVMPRPVSAYQPPVVTAVDRVTMLDRISDFKLKDVPRDFPPYDGMPPISPVEITPETPLVVADPITPEAPLVVADPITAEIPTFIDVAQAETNPMLKWGLLAVGAYILIDSFGTKPKRRRVKRRKR